MDRSAGALERVFDPDKLNDLLLGQSIPHLRGHLVPRYYGDPTPDHPIRPNAGARHLEPPEYPRLAQGIRTAL